MQRYICMTSFESFRILNLKKNISILLYIFILFFLLKQFECDKLHHFMKKSKQFASNYGIITGIKIKLCKKSCKKEKVGRVKI